MGMRKGAWRRRELFVLVLLFYFLGILTSLLFYLFVLLPSPSLLPNKQEQHEEYSRLYRPSSDYSSAGIADSRIHKELWETTTVLRSALYQFVRQKGYMPKHLSTLTQPFPENYLTSLPKEPVTLSKDIVSDFTGQGGWVYKPAPLSGAENESLKDLVAQSVFPNVEWNDFSEFSPLEIRVLKNSHELHLVSGDVILYTYKVGLGAQNSTPEGSFAVQKKVMNPNGQGQVLGESAYGSRGLELSEYAIHGTNKAESIGKNKSKGCIRMHNEDIDELYAMTPLYTPVSIASERSKKRELEHAVFFSGDRQARNKLLYEQGDRFVEQDPDYTYMWAG
jgi:hypothetical protein